jgi:hypothetical protein
MDPEEARKLAIRIVDDFVSSTSPYVDRDCMKLDVSKILAAEGSSVERYKLLHIVIVNPLDFGGSSDSHFHDRMDELLAEYFEPNRKCYKCDRVRKESDQLKCEKCSRWVCRYGEFPVHGKEVSAFNKRIAICVECESSLTISIH